MALGTYWKITMPPPSTSRFGLAEWRFYDDLDALIDMTGATISSNIAMETTSNAVTVAIDGNINTSFFTVSTSDFWELKVQFPSQKNVTRIELVAVDATVSMTYNMFNTGSNKNFYVWRSDDDVNWAMWVQGVPRTATPVAGEVYSLTGLDNISPVVAPLPSDHFIQGKADNLNMSSVIVPLEAVPCFASPGRDGFGHPPMSFTLGTISGVIRRVGTPNTPVQRRVALLERHSLRRIAVTMSDPITGEYIFERVPIGPQYFVVAVDHTNFYNVAGKDQLTPVTT